MNTVVTKNVDTYQRGDFKGGRGNKVGGPSSGGMSALGPPALNVSTSRSIVRRSMASFSKRFT